MENETTVNVGKTLNYFEQIRKNWFLFVFLASVVMGYAQIQNRLDNLEGRTTKIELRADTYEKSVNDLRSDIASIKTSLDFIKDKLR